MKIEVEQRSLFYQFLIFLVLATGILIAGYLYYQNYEQEFRVGVENQLKSVGDLKVDELVSWRTERIGDARVFINNSLFSSQVSEFQHNPENSRVKQNLLNWLSNVQSQFHYNRIFLLSPEGKMTISVPNTSDSVSSTVLEKIPTVFEEKDITVIDFYRDEYDQKIYLTILVPIFDPEIRTRPLGVLALHIDPDEYLYPYISRWPTISSSAETLLLRRDGDSVLYLNDLRFTQDTPLSLRLPLNMTDRPAVKAALGQEGIVEGLDYRGVPVFAYIRKIPETPWFMVARIDTSEVLKPLQAKAVDLTIIVLFLLFVTGSGLYVFRKREDERVYREKVAIQNELLESEERLRLSIDAVNDAIWDWNIPTGTAIFSPRWYTMLGYESGEMAPTYDTWRSLIHPDDLNQTEQRIQKTILNKKEGFTIEFRMRTKADGWCWILARGKVIESDKDGNPIRMVGTHTEINERKRYEQELILKDILFNSSAAGNCYADLNGRITHVNAAFLLMWGLLAEDVVIGRLITDFFADEEETFSILETLRTVGLWRGEFLAKRPDGSTFINRSDAISVRDQSGELVGFFSSNIDVTIEREYEEALKREQERLFAVLETIPAFVYLQAGDYSIPFANRAFRELFGEREGRPCYQVIQNRDSPCEECITLDVLRTSRPAVWEWTNPDGRTFMIYDTRFPSEEKEMVLEIGIEITDLKFAEKERERLINELARSNEQLSAAFEELSGSEEELRYQYNTLAETEEHLKETSEYLENLITYANVPIIVWDPSYTITRINHACESLIGRSADEIVGSPLELLFPEKQKEYSIRLIETTRAGVRWDTVEMAIQHQDGSIRSVLWNTSMVYSPDGDTPVATIAQGQDITLRKQLERENEISLMQIQKNLAQLSILNDEIRNPLMVILMSADMVGDTKVTEIIAEQTKRIDEMVIQLDQRWIESEKVLTMIRKNYQINASSSADLISTRFKEVGPGMDESENDADSSSTLHRLLAEEIQAELYTILDSIDAFVFVADLQTYEILYLNRLGRSLFGDIAGKTCYQIIQKDQSGPCPFCTNHLLIDEIGPTGVHQREIKNTRNGRWYDCRDRVIRWSDGRLVHLQVATDITERKSIEDELRENEYTFRKLYEESSDPILLMQDDRFIECNQAALDMLGISDKELFIGSNPLDISPEYQPDGRLSTEAAPEYIAKAHREGHFRFEWMVRRVDETPILLEVSLLPITFKGEEMLHVTWRDITEWKQLDKAIRESEGELRAILDATPFPVALVDIHDNCIQYWSRSALSLFGHVAPTTPEWYQIAYPDPDYRQEVIDRWKPFLERAKNTNLPVNTGEYQVTCKDGTVRICELYATFLPDKLIVTFNDVTGRKQSEELLKKANDELLSLTEELEEREEELAEQIQEIVRAKNEWEGIFQAIGNPILILDPSNRICDANHVILALSGKTLEELRTMQCWELFHGPSKTQPPKCCPFEKMKISGKLETAEMEVEAFGEVFLVSCSPIFNPDGTLDRVIHIATNITEHKRVEEALISAQKKLKETHRLAHIGTWEWTKGDDIVIWSEELCTIAGTDHELPAPTYAELPRFFTPSSWQRLDDALSRTMTSGEPYSLELELIHPDGTIRWVIAFLGVTRDRMGTITGLHGTLQDITDRKLAEESLRESEAILQDFIENNPLSIQIVDWDGYTLTVNRAHTLLFGSKPPSDFSIFSDLIHKQPELEKYILLLKDGEMVHLPDIRYNVHDTYPEYPDNPVWIRAIMFPLPDKNGKSEKFVFMHENITERKQAQEVLHESNKKLRLLTGITRHDIFNQLAAVQIFQDLALVTSDLEKIHEYITLAKEAGERIEKTIGFTREYENFGVASSGWQLVYQIVESSKEEISPDSITIQNLIPHDLEVYADPIIRKVFTTLIENAIRHGGNPSVISFSCDIQDVSLIITCKDDGVGVPSEEKENIFDHGYGKHTGIGLFLAREILSITGLSIRECGVFGEGARFEILVPTGKYRIHLEKPI